MSNTSSNTSSNASSSTPAFTAHPAAPHAPALMPIAPRPDAVMVRGHGSWLWDADGKRYLDFIQGWAVNALGHCPDVIVDALQTQAATLISPSPALHNAPQLELANLLTRLSGLHQAHFANSGAEANEAAVKLARKWGQKHRHGAFEVITTHSAFHGRTLAMMSASGKPGWDNLYAPMPAGFRKVAFGDAQAMADAIGPQTVALMVEPIQGEAGVVVPPPEYLETLRRIADDAGILLIADEVQTGMGRTGHMFAVQGEAVMPDLMTLGKGLGGGVPVSALLAAEHVCCFEYGDQGGTYNGNPLMTAVALAVTRAVSGPGFLARVQRNGALLRDGLAALAMRQGLGEVRGAGLLLAVHVPHANAPEIAAAAMQAGLLVNAPRPDTLRLMPALTVQADEIASACELLEQAVVAVASAAPASAGATP